MQAFVVLFSIVWKAGLCLIILNSPHAGLFGLSLIAWKEELYWIILNSPYAGLCWIVLKSLESRPLLDCAKQSGKQTFVGLC